MGKFIDLTDKKFTRLKVVKRDIDNKNGHATWICECDCGNKLSVNGSKLRNGRIKSCGCLRRESPITHNMSHTRLYGIWHGMRERCRNINKEYYDRYGGRGVSVCEEWENNFQAFYDWAIVNGYSDKLSIDRIDNDGNYEPNNCRWTTQSIQCQNQGIKSNNLSGIKGVSWDKSRNKWVARITLQYKQIHIGYFESIQDAEIARIDAELKYWGQNYCG